MERLKEVVFLVMGFLGIVVLVLGFKQYSFYTKAQKNYVHKRYVEAIDDYAMVVYMHLPFSPLEKRAIESLLKISQEIKDNSTLQLYVLERLRSSIYATRSFYTPHQEVLSKLNSQIITIKANALKQAGYKRSKQEIKQELKAVMSKELAPNPILAFISISSFFCFVLLTTLGIIRSTKDNKFNGVVFLKFFPFILLSLIIWAYFLWLA